MRFQDVGVAAVITILVVSLGPSVTHHSSGPAISALDPLAELFAPNGMASPAGAEGPVPPAVAPASSQYGQVSASVNLLTGTVAHGPIPFTVGHGPVAIAADPSHGYVDVVDQISGNLAILNATTGALVKWTPVGFWPTSIAYDGVSGGLFVTKPLTDNISFLNSSVGGVAANLNYIDSPSSVTVDYTNNSTGSLVATGHGTHAVFWIGNENFTTFWSTDPSVPDSPYLSDPVEGIAVQPSVWPSAQLLVADFATSSLEEFCNFHEGSQYFWDACAAPAVGSNPDGMVYDSFNQHVYVVNAGSDNVTVLAAHVTGTTVTMPVWSSVGSIPVGTVPLAITFDPHNGDLFVVNQGSDNVTVIDGATDKVVGSVAVGSEPDALSFDSANDRVYVANYLTDNVSVFNATNFTSLAERISVRTAFVPIGLVSDGANGKLEVLSSDSNAILALNESDDSLSGGTLKITGWTAPGPGQLAYDEVNRLVYGVQVSDGGVLLSDGTGTSYIPTGPGEIAVAFDPVGPPVVYVLNLSGGVLVLNGSTSINVTGGGTLLLGGTSLGGAADALGIDLANGAAYVANGPANSVTALSWAPSTGVRVLGSVGVGSGPDAVAFDPANGYLYVANRLSNNVSVIASTPANPAGGVIASIPVGSAPSALAYDPASGYVYVADSGSNALSVINGSTDSVVGTIPVGAGPSGLAVGPSGELFVTDANDSSVSSVSVASYPVTFNETGLPPGTNWTVDLGSVTGAATEASLVIRVSNGTFGALTPVLRLLEATGIFYYFGHGDDGHHTLVTVSGGPQVVPVTFSQVRVVPLKLKEVGLPAGVTWGASVLGTVQTNTTVPALSGRASSAGLVSFVPPVGPVYFSLNSPAGYGVASVVGPGAPTQSSANLTRATTWTVTFGAVREIALGISSNPKFEPFVTTNWSVTLSPALRSGPPEEVLVSYLEGNPDVPIITGAVYNFAVFEPDSLYTIAPSTGRLSFGSHLSGPLATGIRFYEKTWTKVFFNESGLPLGTDWLVTLLGGPSGGYKFPYTLDAKPGKMGFPLHVREIGLLLSVGTYKWVAWNPYTSKHVTGTLTITLPGPDWVPVVF